MSSMGCDINSFDLKYTFKKALQSHIEYCKMNSNLMKGGERYEAMRSPDG